MNFSKRLKELRTDKNLSQQQLADKTGLSSSSIARWELNQAEPTANAVIALAKFFEVSTDYILGLDDY